MKLQLSCLATVWNGENRGVSVWHEAEMAKGFLEVFKFGLYVAIPVGMMLVVANPENLEKLIRHVRQVPLPPLTDPHDAFALDRLP